MSGPKWVTAQHLNIVLDAESERGSFEGRKFSEPPVRVGGKVSVSRLTDGTSGGRTVAILQVDIDDGSTVIVETSLRLLDSVVRAFKARDEAEGRPE